MKSFNKLLLLFAFCCFGLLGKAQSTCGVNAFFGYYINPNQVHQFIDSSSWQSGWQPTNWYWTFGDGAVSNLQNPSHQYTTPGNYTVCLIVIAQGNGVTCMDTFCSTVGNCNNMVQASFTYTLQGAAIGCFGSGSSNYPPLTYAWDFGDGAVGSGQNATHQYSFSGVYHVCLTVTDANGCSATYCQYVSVTVNLCGNANASFTTSNQSGVVTLTSTSTGTSSNTLYQWWMDGQALTNPNPNTSYTVTAVSSGNHTFCLYLYNANPNTFCDSTCQSVNITSGNPCGNLSAGFQTTQQGNAVNFWGNTSNPTGTVFTWSFGDGLYTNGTSTTSVHTYPSNPNTTTYNACLIVSIPGTVCADTFCQAVVIPGSTTPQCQAYFVTTTQGSLAAFTNSSSTSSGTITSYSWTFGDGTTSTLAAPTHTYNTPGWYAVCLTIATSNGCSSSYCDSVQIGGSCQLAVTIVPSGSNPVILQAVATGGTGGPYTYYWNSSNSAYLTVTQNGTYCVSVFDGNQCAGTACYTVTGIPQSNDTICGYLFNDANGNGVQDNGETPISGGVVHAGNYSATSNANGYYVLIVPNGNYYLYYCPGQGYSLTIPLAPNQNGGTSSCGYYYNVSVAGYQCGFNFGVQNNSVNICGTVYFDGNNNGVQDSTENGIANAHVYIQKTGGSLYHAYTDQQGHYCVIVPAGTYTITVSSSTFPSCQISPATQSITVVAGQQVSNANFAIYCQPGSCNLSLNITPHTTVTAGFPAWYDIQVCNVGSGVSSGTVNMFYDPVLHLNYASPVQTSHNTSTHTLSWSLNNLAPGACQSYWISFQADSTVPLNQFVFTLANVISSCNDVNLNNNVDTIHQAVTGSWDPNNKLAYMTNYDNPNYQQVSSVNANQRIEYVVNFQNTGSGPAVNVVVNDLLSADLDANSFEFLGASHACAVTQNAGDLSFKFSDIMLPAESVDETNSHGWIKFAVNASNGLPGGHVISDDAAIYFDYNAAVVTNDAAVTMLEPNGIDEVMQNVTVVVAPNPMSEYAIIRLNSTTTGFKFRVMDITGRLVNEQNASDNSLQFDRNSLASGIYTYQVIQNNKPVAKGKLVIE
ncbi:MAG: PKD domain-containing protein [Chitinophagales bacterium]